MRLSTRLPNLHSSQGEKAWRKLFSKSRRTHSRTDSQSTEISLPTAELPSLFTSFSQKLYEPCTTPSPRTSSEYSFADIPPYRHSGDSDCSSPTVSSWTDPTPGTPRQHGRRFPSVFPTRPLSIFSFRQADDDISEDLSASSQATFQAEDQLVLTMTSKYPTGLAADLYVPVDVSMPARPGFARRMSSKVRPQSSHGLTSSSNAPPMPLIPLRYRHNTLVHL